jgi:hypothetical protein
MIKRDRAEVTHQHRDTSIKWKKKNPGGKARQAGGSTVGFFISCLFKRALCFSSGPGRDAPDRLWWTGPCSQQNRTVGDLWEKQRIAYLILSLDLYSCHDDERQISWLTKPPNQSWRQGVRGSDLGWAACLTTTTAVSSLLANAHRAGGPSRPWQ